MGRAGAVTVSEDGGASLVVNPAGMARREAWRAQVGVALLDRGLGYLADAGDGGTDGEEAPLVENRAPVARLPQLSLQGAIGPVVVGLAYLETGARSAILPAPPFNQLAADVIRLYPHRYAGTRLEYRERALTAGLALRATSWLGLGLALGAARVALLEERRIWAGFAGRDSLLEPDRDLALSLSGHDGFVPRVAFGVLLAPPDVPLEMALSMNYVAGARVRGVPAVAATRQTDFPAVESIDPTSVLELGQRVVMRTGVRYLGERFSVEFGGELEFVGGDAAAWSITGVRIHDETNREFTLETAPTLAVERSHGGLRWAAEVEVVPGFLWLSGGYAITGSGSPRARVSPAFADLGGHTVAAGAEAQWNGIAVTIGYARTMTGAWTVEHNQLSVVNPFAASGGTTGHGRYQTSRDLFGVALEASWPP